MHVRYIQFGYFSALLTRLNYNIQSSHQCSRFAMTVEDPSMQAGGLEWKEYTKSSEFYRYLPLPDVFSEWRDISQISEV